jgi:hypothetical protein
LHLQFIVLIYEGEIQISTAFAWLVCILGLYIRDVESDRAKSGKMVEMIIDEAERFRESTECLIGS